jgi:hypothetical protein
MGYKTLTGVIRRIPFKAHYHAHIHSILDEDVVGVTPTINRSFMALAKFKREALEPLPKALIDRNEIKI